MVADICIADESAGTTLTAWSETIKTMFHDYADKDALLEKCLSNDPPKLAFAHLFGCAQFGMKAISMLLAQLDTCLQGALPNETQ